MESLDIYSMSTRSLLDAAYRFQFAARHRCAPSNWYPQPRHTSSLGLRQHAGHKPKSMQPYLPTARTLRRRPHRRPSALRSPDPDLRVPGESAATGGGGRSCQDESWGPARRKRHRSQHTHIPMPGSDAGSRSLGAQVRFGRGCTLAAVGAIRTRRVRGGRPHSAGAGGGARARVYKAGQRAGAASATIIPMV